MSRRRRKSCIRFSPYIVILGLGAGFIIRRFGGDIIDDIKSHELQDLFVNEKEADENIDLEIDDNLIVFDSFTNIGIEALNEAAKVIKEGSSLIAEEEIVENIPFISDELLTQGYEFKDINFDELIDINPNACAWITLDNSNIDYPIMYAPDREDNFYLYHDIYGKESHYGVPYIYSENNSLNNFQEDISDVTLVFGHRIRGGKMFAQVGYFAEQSYYDEHPFAVIYTADGYAYKASFFAGIITDAKKNEHIYRSYFKDEEMFDEFVGYLKDNSTFTSEVDVNYGDKIIGLITCEYTGGPNSRYVLYGVLEKQYIDELQISNNVACPTLK